MAAMIPPASGAIRLTMLEPESEPGLEAVLEAVLEKGGVLDTIGGSIAMDTHTQQRDIELKLAKQTNLDTTSSLH